MPALLLYEMLLVIGFLVAVILWLEYQNWRLKRGIGNTVIALSAVTATLARHNQILKHRCDRLRAGLRNKIELMQAEQQKYQSILTSIRVIAKISHAGLVSDQVNGKTMVPMRALRDIQNTIANLQAELALQVPKIQSILERQKAGKKELPLEQVPAEATQETGPERLGESEGTAGRPSDDSPVAAGAGNERLPV